MKYLVSILLFSSTYSWAQIPWKIVVENEKWVLRCVDFVDHITGYAVGDSGLIVKTVDGGITWTEIDYGQFGNLKLVAVLNHDTVVACGENFIIRTINGKDWKQVFSGADEVIRYLKFMTNGWGTMSGRVVASGNKGLLLLSNNYGEKWFKKDVSGVTGDVDLLCVLTNYAEEFKDTFARLVGVDGYEYRTKDNFKSRYGDRGYDFKANSIDVIHTDHEFKSKEITQPGIGTGPNGAFLIYNNADNRNLRRFTDYSYSGAYHQFYQDQNKLVRVVVGEGGVLAEGLGTITSPTWKTYREITIKDLYWVDHGIKPDNIDKVVFAAVGDGVILRRTFGDHIVSSSEIKPELDFSIYPNPTSADFVVSIPGLLSRSTSLGIYNANGQLLKEHVVQATNKPQEITVTKPAMPGVYFIRLDGIGGSITKKIIVE